MLHKLTHKHADLYKPGIGRIRLCGGRFRNRGIINMSVSMDEIFDTVYVVPQVEPQELEAIFNCKSEDELAIIIIDMMDVRRGTKSEVKVVRGAPMGN